MFHEHKCKNSQITNKLNPADLKIIHQDQVEFIPVCKPGSPLETQLA